MESIISYSNAHNNFQLATLSASEAGIGILSDIKEELCFEGDELKRIEDESGIPLSEEQTTKVDTYFKIVQRINNVLFITRRCSR